jgi:peroxiredoxin
MKKILFHSIGYTLVAGIFFWAGALTRDYLVTKELKGARVRSGKFLNKPAPPLASVMANSTPWSLQDQKGKVVVLDLWATWCGPCVASMLTFKSLYERFGHRPEFALIGVSLDNDASTVQQYCAAHDIPWEQLIEPRKKFDNSIARALEVDGVPFTCVIDQKGIVRFYDHSAHVEGVVARLLEEPNQTPTAVTPAAEQPARQP